MRGLYHFCWYRVRIGVPIRRQLRDGGKVLVLFRFMVNHIILFLMVLGLFLVAGEAVPPILYSVNGDVEIGGDGEYCFTICL